jgi:hypothetical protein
MMRTREHSVGTWSTPSAGGAGAVVEMAGRETPRGSALPARPLPPKLYRISEIVEYSGVSRQTIHNYTTMGLISEARRTSGGHRMYDESVFAQLDQIEKMKRSRKSLRDIRAYFAKLPCPR